MVFLKRTNWQTIGFVAAAAVGLVFAVMGFISANSRITRFMITAMLFMIILQRTGKVHLPWWRDSDKGSH